MAWFRHNEKTFRLDKRWRAGRGLKKSHVPLTPHSILRLIADCGCRPIQRRHERLLYPSAGAKAEGEARPDDAKSTFLAQNVLRSPTMVPSSPLNGGSGLPTAASGDSISPERPVVRWMSAKRGRRAAMRAAMFGGETIGERLTATRGRNHRLRLSRAGRRSP